MSWILSRHGLKSQINVSIPKQLIAAINVCLKDVWCFGRRGIKLMYASCTWPNSKNHRDSETQHLYCGRALHISNIAEENIKSRSVCLPWGELKFDAAVVEWWSWPPYWPWAPCWPPDADWNEPAERLTTAAAGLNAAAAAAFMCWCVPICFRRRARRLLNHTCTLASVSLVLETENKTEPRLGKYQYTNYIWDWLY